jgi:2-keto-3-deoxy-L-rhamnonate aldolase RhmA
MVETIEAIRDSCRAHGIVPGIQTRNETLARFWKERGMLFLGCGNEASLLYERARQLVSALS